MPVTDEMLARARRLEPGTVEALLADVYPAVRRISLALIGDERRAAWVEAGVLERGVRVMPGWRHGTTPENWFFHHTVITAREAAAGGAGPADPPSTRSCPNRPRRRPRPRTSHSCGRCAACRRSRPRRSCCTTANA